MRFDRVVFSLLLARGTRSFGINAATRRGAGVRLSRSPLVAPRVLLPRTPTTSICQPQSIRLGSTSTNGEEEALYGGSGDMEWEESREEAEDKLEDGDEDALEFEDDDDVEEEPEEEQSNKEDELVEEFLSWSKALNKAVQTMEKKGRALKQELEKAQTVEQTMERAQLLVSNLYLFQNDPQAKSIKVIDWENDGAEMELTLDPKYGSAKEEAEALFERARKLKRGSKVVENLLEETNRAFQILLDAKMDLESIKEDQIDEGRLRLVQDRLERTSRQTNFRYTPQPKQQQNSSRSGRSSSKRPRSTMESNIRKLRSPGGCVVLVGRNRRGNEYLSLTVARGNDIWMHARGCPGAHVILQNRRGSPQPSEDCIQFCANLAVFYSDARTERKASVTAAEPKHILKPRGAPLGAVKLREELYTLVGKPLDVPEELKAAREESGLTDEFRASDKAKHRKRTKAVAKQEQAKRRAQAKAKRKRRTRGDNAVTGLMEE